MSLRNGRRTIGDEHRMRRAAGADLRRRVGGRCHTAVGVAARLERCDGRRRRHGEDPLRHRHCAPAQPWGGRHGCGRPLGGGAEASSVAARSSLGPSPEGSTAAVGSRAEGTGGEREGGAPMPFGAGPGIGVSSRARRMSASFCCTCNALTARTAKAGARSGAAAGRGRRPGQSWAGRGVGRGIGPHMCPLGTARLGVQL